MRSNTPLPVAVKFDAVDVSSTGEHVLALARDGSVYAWGRGDAGQLGIGPMPVVNYKTRSARVENFMPLPVRIPGLTDVVAISTGDRHSLALLKDGTVRAWGQNRFGQVGDGTTINRDTPTPVQGVRNVVAIAALGYSSVAVLSDGTAMDWGNTHGSSDPRPVPAAVVGARGLRSVVGGGAHVVALTQTGGVMTWGTSGHYETGRGRERDCTGARQGAHRRRVYRCLTVGQRSRPGVRPHHDVVRSEAVAQAGLQRTQQSQSLPDPVVARWTRAALTQFNSQRQRRENRRREPAALSARSNGEMSEWLKEHAWKAIPASSHRATPKHFFAQSTQRFRLVKMLLDVTP